MSDSTGKLVRILFALFVSLSPLAAQEAGGAGAVPAEPVAEPSQMELLDDEWEFKTGDRLIYEVQEERAEEPMLLSVNARGEVLVPLVGSVPAEGKTSKELAYELKAELEKDFFHRATVLITQREEDRNRGRITVIGEVNKQGEQLIPVDAPLTVSQAILQGGGFTATADRSNVSVVTDGEDEPRAEIDVGAMMDSGDFSEDPMLQAGDVVIVPRANQVDSKVYVLGAVQTPGLLTIRENEATISQAVMKAGGFTRFARTNRVKLVTKDESGEKEELEIDVGKILKGGDRSEDRVVKPGDMIIVEEKMISFSG
ncbi:MAG: polysaccharide biosynthesis/export family protein [Verrucomicrobiota bacterium]